MAETLTFEEYKEISKEIKRLMQEERYEEALALCTEENCRQHIAIQRQKITILFELGNKQEEIIVECDKAYQIWKDEGFIKYKFMAISQIIKRLMQEERYEEALELCTEENCRQEIAIQRQKIDILFKLGNKQEEIIVECDKAYQIWQDESFIKWKFMAISQIIKRLTQEERYEEALELCTEENCKQEIAIQSQKINILFKLGNKQEKIIVECEKAYQIWKDESFIKYKFMAISQIIKKLMQEEKYEEALELCTEENCKQEIAIQRQKITILFKLGNKQEKIIVECEKAYQIWQDESFIKWKFMAISQMIKKKTQEEKYKEALELCTEENCKQNIVIQNQKISILIKLKRYTEALKEANKNSCKSDLITKKLKNKIHTTLKEMNINAYLTFIYCDDIGIDDLNNLSMELWEKVILHIAYYEKHSKKTGLELIKQAMIQMDLTKEQQKILNKLKERLSSKKSIIFDCVLYCEILDCTIDSQYVSNHKVDKSLVQNTTSNTTKKQYSSMQKEEPSRKESKSKIVGQEGKRINRYSNSKNNSSVINLQKEEKVLLIKDIFSKELLEIKKYVYWEMNWGTNRLGATRVWDTLECLEIKKAKDELAYQKMLRIIEICVSNQVIQLETQNIRILKNPNKK